MPRTWKFRPLGPLERENDQLRMVVIQLRHEHTTKEGYAAKLELVGEAAVTNHRRFAQQARTRARSQATAGSGMRTLGGDGAAVALTSGRKCPAAEC